MSAAELRVISASEPVEGPIGTVSSDPDSPTFEMVRVKLKPGSVVKPNAIVRIPQENVGCVLIGRVRAGHHHNPHESPEDINVRDALGIKANYPAEEDRTIIYRVVEVDLIGEFTGKDLRAPETLPQPGSAVFAADDAEVRDVLGLATGEEDGLFIGHLVTGSRMPVFLERTAIQRHFFIGGTTGSGKSHAMKVLTEEFVRHRLPVVFLDTRGDYGDLVHHLGGKVMRPGDDFTIRISSLTDVELVKLVPGVSESEVQKNIISAAFLQLQDEIADPKNPREKFVINDLLDRIDVVGPSLTNTGSSIALARKRTELLRRDKIFGEGLKRTDWPRYMIPCLSIDCKRLKSRKLQTVATALLRELEDLRLRGHIPPYVAVIDEAHLFVPQGEDSPCKQIIRESVRIGRHHGIAMVLLTQSPVDIDKSTIRQCNTRMIFALEPDQLDAIRGVKADATEEMLRALPKQEQGTCLLSGTYESVRHAITVHFRELEHKVQGGATPPIFEEMKEWLKKLAEGGKDGQ